MNRSTSPAPAYSSRPTTLRPASPGPPRCRGFTMIEMLVSLTITMIMMLAVVTLFQVMTDSVSGSRALLEAGDRLRACRNRLQADLQGATATMLPPCARKTTKGILKLVRE